MKTAATYSMARVGTFVRVHALTLVSCTHSLIAHVVECMLGSRVDRWMPRRKTNPAQKSEMDGTLGRSAESIFPQFGAAVVVVDEVGALSPPTPLTSQTDAAQTRKHAENACARQSSASVTPKRTVRRNMDTTIYGSWL